MKASIIDNLIIFEELSQAELKHLKKVLSWTKDREDDEIDTLLSRTGSGYYATLAGLYYPLSNIFDIELLTPLEEPSLDGIELRSDIVDGKILRDYQMASIRKCIMHKKGIAELATGAGKTILAIGMIKTLEEHDKISNSLIIVPSEPIMKQFHQAEISAGLRDTGIIYGGRKDYGKHHIVALADSINRGLKYNHEGTLDTVLNADITVFDECHHLASSKFASIALVSKSEYRIGLSGTPFKEDGILEYVEDALVCGIAGRVISRVSQKWLVERNYIAEPLIFMKPVKGRYAKYKARYNTIYQREIIGKVVRNQYIVDYCDIFFQHGLSVLVVVNQKAHATNLMSMLRKKNPNIVSICIFGGSQAVKFDEFGCLDSYKIDFDRFATDYDNGVYNVVFATQVLEEGYDLPSVGALIMCGAGKSRRQVRQRVGRGVRSKSSGRNVVFILDFIDRGHVYTYSQSIKRLNKIYIDDMEADVLETEKEFLELLKNVG